MKRTRRWLLMFAALICLMAHVGALRAASYSRITSTSTVPTTKTTVTTTAAGSTDKSTDEETTEAVTESTNSTKSTLTGIPQIDYIWDPNLPRELNGYNLSDYPFLNSVPIESEVGFKCDPSLHDGFYASMKYNCQLYHHCIYGVRYDFLCANFTAFDQRTFICHFASEVDCQNSAKYFFRNDALYVNPTTTTTKPTTTVPPPTSAPQRPRPLRRPLRRRRPQADYYYDDEEYDEYYEDRPAKRRKQRPRNRRPEYDDYDSDDRFDRRGAASSTERNRNRQDDDEYEYERRPNDRPRHRNRPSDTGRNNEEPERRKTIEDDRKPFIEDRRNTEVEKRPSDKRYSSDRRPAYDERRTTSDDRRPVNDERRAVNDERRPVNDDRRSTTSDRRPVNTDRRPSSDDRRPAEDDRRSYNERRKHTDDRRPAYDDPPRRESDRPYRRDEDDDDRPLKRPYKDEVVDEPAKIKPTATGTASGSIFDRPRVPPKIRRPVPVNERTKFDYSTSKPIPVAALDDSEYYDEYEEDPLPPKPKAPVVREEPKIENKRKLGGSIRRPEPVEVKRPVVSDDEYYEDEYEERPKTPVLKPPKNNREIIREDDIVDAKVNSRPITREKFPFRENPRNTAVRPNPKDGYNQGSADIREVISTDSRESSFTSFKPKFDRFSSKESTHNSPKEAYKPILRETVKQRDPFRQTEDRDSYTFVEKEIFPKNSPQNPENLRIAFRTPYDDPMSRSHYEEEPIREPRPAVRVVKRPFLPSRGGSPYLPRGLQPLGGTHSDPVTESVGIKLLDQNTPIVKEYKDSEYQTEPLKKGPRTTQTPKIESQKSPLDEIYDSDYDVTLNDALNPTLKPLSPSRGSPVGFTLSNKFDRNHLSSIPYSPSDISYSPSENRPTAIRVPISRSSPSVYDDYEY